MNRVCEILGITKPVVQAPMTWITSPELAAGSIVNELARGYEC